MKEVLLSKKSPIVVELIKQMEQVRKVDNEKYVDLACDLFDMAQEEGNEDLRNFASCTLGDALCQNKEYSQAVYYLSEGLQGILNTDAYCLICRCYNEMGLIMRSEGHFITSEENYLNSIDTARAHRLYYQEAIACGNFASLCAEMGARNEALEYHFRAIECCQFIEDEQLRTILLVTEFSQIAKLYVLSGRPEEAKKNLDEMNRLNVLYPDVENDFDVALARWYYFDTVKEHELAKKYKKESLKAFLAVDDVVAYFDEIESLISKLYDQKDYSNLQQIFDHIDFKVAEDEVINIRLRMEGWKVKVYETLGEMEKASQCALNYFKYSSIRAKANKKSFTTMLRMKTELLQQKTRNLFLTAQAETDTLTGLANRMKLNNVIDELFEMAKDKGVNLGVEMMDVDFFKKVNDNYGHSKGDELLSVIGREFKEIHKDYENIFIARYGGDEFIICYYGMTDEEILRVVRRINNMMEKVAQEIELENISVSQGIVNHVPQSLNRAWDYLNSADYALYFVKEHGRANARLIHKRSDLENEEWVKVF